MNEGVQVDKNLVEGSLHDIVKKLKHKEQKMKRFRPNHLTAKLLQSASHAIEVNLVYPVDMYGITMSEIYQ
jgi:hypothetical protein